MSSPALPSSVPPLALSIAAQLAEIPGVVAVVLGGSHAQGTADVHSDIDLSVSYDVASPFDLGALNALCRELDDTGDGRATPPGGWGPWVDGGVNLTVSGQRVDFIYRELGRVAQSVEDALAGRISLHAQVLHPHGIHGHHYAAELDTCLALHDLSGRIETLKLRLGGYPDALAEAIEHHYHWQPGFWLSSAEKALQRGDVHYAQGLAYQAVMACVQVLCARARRWILNEKGAVALAGTLAPSPTGFTPEIQCALRDLDILALRDMFSAAI